MNTKGSRHFAVDIVWLDRLPTQIMDSIGISTNGVTKQEFTSVTAGDEIEISWRLDSRAAKRIRLELGLNPISWCETPSPDGDSSGAIAVSYILFCGIESVYCVTLPKR